MISIEGYSTLAEFHLAAQRSIRLRLQADRQALADERRQTHRAYLGNVAIAAKFLVQDLFLKRATGVDGQDVFILRPDRSRIRLNLKLLAPAEELDDAVDAFANARLEFYGGRWGAMGEGIFGLKSLRSNYWHSSFLATQIFRQRERRLLPSVRDVTRFTPIVDWNTSTISLADLRLFSKSLDLIYEASAGFSALGIATGNRVFHRESDVRIGSPSAILEMLSPFEGHTVIAPGEWEEELFSDLRPREAEGNTTRQARNHKDMIIELHRASPTMTREEIKEALFRELSDRQFDRYWKQATDEAPGLKRPGRRKAKS